MSSYIILTADHGKIRKVRKRLRRKGYNAYVPALVIKRIVPKAGKIKRRRIIKPLMSYIMVEVPAPEVFGLWFHDVLETDDVRGYLKSGDDPATIGQAGLDALKLSVQAIRFDMEAARVKARLRRGMKAAIKSGSLAGKSGTVKWLRGKKAGLEAMLLGSMRVVEVEAANLEAA